MIRILTCWAALALMVLAGACAAARPAPNRVSDLPTADWPDIYATVIAQLVPGLPETDYWVVEDVTQFCTDFEDPYVFFKDYFPALSSAGKAAHRDCAQKGAVDFRVPVEAIYPSDNIRARSALEGYTPDDQHPLILLSRPGVDPDSTYLVVQGGFYCGPVCASSDLFTFERDESGWHLVSRWTMWVS